MIGEGITGWHATVVIGVCDPLNQRAGGRVARMDHRSKLAASQGPVPHIEAESTLLQVRAVAVAAAIEQQRSDVTFEVDFIRSSPGKAAEQPNRDHATRQQGAGATRRRYGGGNVGHGLLRGIVGELCWRPRIGKAAAS